METVPVPSAPPVDATALSRYTQTFELTALNINGTESMPKISDQDATIYWFVIVDLSSLDMVVNVTSESNAEVPTEVQAYMGKPGFFLYCIANAQSSKNVPQGALHAFLRGAGSSAGLADMEQIIGQLGTGSIRHFSYILATTLDTGDLPGFEAFSTQGYVTLPMQFVPFTVDGKTSYVPSRHTTL